MSYLRRLVDQGIEDGLLEPPAGFGWVGPTETRGIPKKKVATFAKIVFKLTEAACADRIDCTTDRSGTPMWKLREEQR